MDRTENVTPGQQRVTLRWERRRWPSALGWALVAATFVSGPGCTPVVGLLVLAKGFKTVPAEFAALKGERVIVLCQSEVAKHPNIHTEFAKRMSRKLRDEGIETISHDEVVRWFDAHPEHLHTVAERDTMRDIATAFEADYVLLVKIQTYSLNEERSWHLYRGRALTNIEVYDVEADALAWEKTHDSVYPLERPIPVDEMREPLFEQEFLRHLSNDLGRYFYAHEPGEDVLAF